jgi:hypothetical protein
MLAIAAKLVGSLLAVLALGWFARWLDLGGDARIRDAGHAKKLAFEGVYGFKARDAVVDMAGYSALVKDKAGRHVLIAKKGNGFVTRMLQPPIEGRLDQRFLTIDVQEPDMAPVTLNLGDNAQYWAAGLRHIPND